MDKNTICYLCKGCGIGEALNFEGLAEVLKEMSIDNIKEHNMLCSSEGLSLIQSDIENGATHLLIGACSCRDKTKEFSFGDDIETERSALREFVVLGTDPTYEGEEEEGICRQEVGEDCLRMSAVKLDKTLKVVPYQIEGDLYRTILVVGGGPAGMSAAIEASKVGYDVVLVEKESELGGFLKKMAKRAPESAPYVELQEIGLDELVDKIKSDENIKVYTGTEIIKTSGMPGKFEVKLSNDEEIKIGAIVQATGWIPYNKTNLKEVFPCESEGVLSNVEMEEKIKAGNLSNLNSVAFIQCAGSRDKDHLPYCSAFCCLVSCKQAIMVKDLNPEASVYIIYKDLRTPGQSEEVYREAQRRGVVFIRRDEEYPIIDENNGKFGIKTKDVLLNDELEIEDLDLVILATGMCVNNPKMIDIPVIPFEVSESDGKKLTDAAKAEQEDWSILNLQYRQGPNLPTIKYSMPDSHFICFPYESRRTGIYPVGTVRKPMRLKQAMDDGIGSVLKSIQAIKSAENGYAMHPRSGDKSYPDFALQRCTQCKRCTDECPFGAINEDEKGNPLPNVTRCRRCSTCMGACPERIISFANYSVDMIGSMLKSIFVPEEDTERYRVVCFVCENDALPAIEMALRKGLKINPYVRFVPVRCLGSMNLVWIADALSKGIDGIMILGCKRGDDYQCHFVRGSELANVRMSKISETLQRLALEVERIGVEEVSIDNAEGIVSSINSFVDKLEDIGMNPFKGF